MFKGIKSPIFVALDVDDRERALDLARAVEPFVGGFKVGPRLCMRYGAQLVTDLASIGHVFVDNKYFDIPNTMEHAIRATFEAGATFATVHAQSGREALLRLAEIERELNQQRPFRILCVTVLTSFSQEGLPPTSIKKSIADQVNLLADMAVDCGLTGLVCSPHEVKQIKTRHPGSFVVTPGIRFDDGNLGDQKRTMGPREALAAGATALVVGRPIVDAAHPAEVAEKYFDETRI